MTQRNPMNERYQSEERAGKTRKSASMAKPVSKAASTTNEPAPKTKKQKREEARQREEKEMQKARALGVDSGNMPTIQYRSLRRQYWAALIGAVVCTGLSFLLSGAPAPWGDWSMYLLLFAYVLIILALYIDMSKIRKLRKGYTNEVVHGKSKAARKEQKARAAELREQRKEAEVAYAAAKENGTLEEKKTVGQRIKGVFGGKKDKQEQTAVAKAGGAKAQPVKVEVEQADAAKADEQK